MTSILAPEELSRMWVQTLSCLLCHSLLSWTRLVALTGFSCSLWSPGWRESVFCMGRQCQLVMRFLAPGKVRTNWPGGSEGQGHPWLRNPRKNRLGQMRACLFVTILDLWEFHTVCFHQTHLQHPLTLSWSTVPPSHHQVFFSFLSFNNQWTAVVQLVCL